MKQQAITVRQKTNLSRRLLCLNRELWLELRAKKGVYHLWKKGWATQEDYKEAMTLYKEKIRRAKAKVELKLATVVKDNLKTHQQQMESTKGYWGSWWQNVHKYTYNYLPSLLVNRGSVNWLEVGKCDFQLQGEPEGGYRKLQAC